MVATLNLWRIAFINNNPYRLHKVVQIDILTQPLCLAF